MGRHFSKVRGPWAYWASPNKKVRGPDPPPPGSDAYAFYRSQVVRTVRKGNLTKLRLNVPGVAYYIIWLTYRQSVQMYAYVSNCCADPRIVAAV